MKKIEEAKQFVSSYRSSFNFFSVIVWTVIVIWVSLFLIFTQQKDVEDIRGENLDKYSEKSKKIQKEIDWREDRKGDLKDEIEDLDEKMDNIQTCLQANSMTGAVVDCDLYFNNNTE